MMNMFTQSDGGQVAMLESHTFTSVGKSCSFTFWHYQDAIDNNGDASTLALIRKTEEDAVSVFP